MGLGVALTPGRVLRLLGYTVSHFPTRTPAPSDSEKLDPASYSYPSYPPGTRSRGALKNLAPLELPTLCFKFPDCPSFPPSPSKGSHLPLLGTCPLSCYILSTLPPTPTQSLSQSISCSFPSDQFLKKDNYPRRQEAENAQSQEHRANFI